MGTALQTITLDEEFAAILRSEAGSLVAGSGSAQ